MSEHLLHGEWELVHAGGSFAWGKPDRGVWNRTTPTMGDADVRSSDVDRSSSDGRAFNRDWTAGQTIAFDIGILGHSPLAVRELTEDMRRVWRADAIRATPGATAELRMNYDGRLRSVFGRPRKWAPDYSAATTNSLVSLVCDFACVDDLFYGEAREQAITSAASVTGGLVAPLASPLSTVASSGLSAATLVVEGNAATWPVVTIRGPIANPVVVVGSIRFDLRLSLVAADDVVVIDPQPWARTVTRNGLSVAGKLRGTRLAAASLSPGLHDVTISGGDPTGTASVVIHWRPAFTSP